MVKIFGMEYMTQKEAAARYGYSQSWFALQRHQKKEPKYLQIKGHSKVLYPVLETDAWFKKMWRDKE